ncbi:MAG: ZIP family metal transporter [Bacilli bacterium]|nr:ZIP family metal transporter [Bacilli bacterium]
MLLLYCLLGILIPFIGTCIGSFLVYFFKSNLSDKYQKVMTGFACGVMLAASIWSLIIPSVEMAESSYKIVWLPAVIGLLLGVVFLIFVNRISDRVQNNSGKGINMLMFSVTLHNIPEGMAVGVCFASVLSGNVGVSLLSAIILALGIAIQNIPEGAIISMPMKLDGVSKKKSFFTGVMSGVVEPIASLITIALINVVVPLLPYLLAFAAGAMIYVVFEELVPEMHNGNKSFWGIISVMIGFIVMMVLDITLG